MPGPERTPADEFVDDSPRESPWEDDQLGFAPFAKRIATTLIGLEAPHGFVVGLQGSWGSGKSTVLNFVKAYVNEHNVRLQDDSRSTFVIDFMPWMISGQQDVISNFFKVLSEEIGDPHARRGRMWRGSGRALRVGVDPLIDAASLVAVAAHPDLATAAPAVKAVAKKSVASAMDRWLAEPSLQSAYEALRKRLKSAGRKIVVMIDDIDRLESAEIRSIFQMVKTVGRLPGVVYLLSYDRVIVNAALDGHMKADADRPSFAEKIVQQELELPTPDRSALFRMLDAQLGFLMEEAPNTTRWHHLVRSGLRHWIRYPRDVFRLSNAVRFAWFALEDEIDPADLLCIEAIRLFDADMFRWIRSSRHFFFNEELFVFASDEKRNEYASSFLDAYSGDDRERRMNVLGALFPSRAGAFHARKSFSSEEHHARTTRRRGMGSKAGYDSYFSLFPAQFAIPKLLIERAVADVGDERKLRDHIEEAYARRDQQGSTLIGDFYEEIAQRITEKPAVRPTQSLLKAVIRSGDLLNADEWFGGFLLFSPGSRWQYLIKSMLKAWDPERAGEYLIQAFDDAASAAVAATIWVSLARELGVVPTEGAATDCPITEKALWALKAPMLRKIEAAAADGSLRDAPFYFDIARAWTRVAGPEPVRKWLETGALDDPKFLAKLTFGLVQHSTSGSRRSYHYRGGEEPSYLDMHLIKQACDRHAEDQTLTDDERNRLRAVQRGIDKGFDESTSLRDILDDDDD